jgi:hypothetical protein
MTTNTNSPPDDLAEDGEGRRLWTWLHAQCEGIEENEPLVIELCRIADRLEQVRAKIKSQGLWITGSKKNSLLDVEIKFSSQYNRLWRQLGLSDKPDEEKRPVGRPPDNEKLWGG